MPAQIQDIILQELRGGLTDEDPPNALKNDECTIANNVEFFHSTLGERRLGCVPLDITGSGLNTEQLIVHLNKHTPTTDEFDAELFALGATYNTSSKLARKVGSTWLPITVSDAMDTAPEFILNVQTQTFNGKMFILYRSASGKDRMHVWDGTSLRAAGIKEPDDPPTAINTSDPGSYVDTRYFRVRFIKKNGDTVLLRSEPSEELTFVPSGTNDGAIITRPAAPGEGETHWEVEASEDGANFYRIATVVLATTTYEDNTILSVEDYEDIGVLSEDIGDYTVPHSAKFITIDQDRIIIASSWEDEELDARVSWSPVSNDPGVGNDERIPLDTDNFVVLDNKEGGAMTGLSSPILGSVYVFKWGHVYRLTRTGERSHAYDAIVISKTCGAIPGSIVNGLDETGAPCVYFLDPRTGPYRVGGKGLQRMRNLRGTWKIVNTAADEVIARGIYYPDKQQVHWWVATEDEDTPNLKIVSQVNELVPVEDGVSRGWCTADGLIAQAYCATVMSEITTSPEGNIYLSFRPYIGLPAPYFIQRCDVGDDDAGEAYIGKIRTKPFFLTGLLNRWGAMTAALLASANQNKTVMVKFVRSFGAETNEVEADLTTEEGEEYKVVHLDNLRMSSAIAIQFEFSDPE